MAKHVAIIGGGAAGIFAALAACEQGARVALYERNSRIGIKILISGGGKCNITHDAPPRELEEGFITREARFLRYALHELTSEQVLGALHREGVETYTRPNGRVFPVSGRAEDVLAAFERMLRRAGVMIRTDARVERIIIEDGAVAGVMVNGELERCDAAIVTTGGMSYQKVGTTGDGIRWGKDLGHQIEKVRPALAPIYFPAAPPPDWQGVALRDVNFHVECDGMQPRLPRHESFPVEWRGDLLLTHRGLSGPVVLEVSRAAARLRESCERVDLIVDILPDSTLDDLRAMWEERVAASGRSQVQTFLEAIIPRSLVPYFLTSAGMESGRKMSEITKAGRQSLLECLKHWRIGQVGEVPLDRGEVSAGGIALTEVSTTTMESKHVRGLYFAGEVLDISGCVGGYNLQAAFSTGFVAGREGGGGR